MKVDLVFNNSTSTKRFRSDFFQQIFEIAARTMKLNGTVELSVNIVSPAKIKSLNKKYLRKNKVTDVLSFPLEDNSLKKYDIMPLGDIFICVDYVKKQVGDSPIELNKTMAHLAVHGFLHLLGYDHRSSLQGAQLMQEKENIILAKLFNQDK